MLTCLFFRFQTSDRSHTTLSLLFFWGLLTTSSGSIPIHLPFSSHASRKSDHLWLQLLSCTSKPPSHPPAVSPAALRDRLGPFTITAITGTSGNYTASTHPAASLSPCCTSAAITLVEMNARHFTAPLTAPIYSAVQLERKNKFIWHLKTPTHPEPPSVNNVWLFPTTPPTNHCLYWTLTESSKLYI